MASWDPRAILAATMIRGVTAMSIWRAGFRWGSVDVQSGGGDGTGKVVKMHYLERAAKGPTRQHQSLVLIPGLTMEAQTFLPLVAKLALPEYFKIIMIELPGQGENRFTASPPWAWHGGTERDQLIVGLLSKLGVSPQNKADILGYSLGGSIVGRLLLSRGDMFRKKVLLAPAFFECIDQDFAELAAARPRQVHAYETLDEAKLAFSKTAFGFYPESLPSDFIMRGLVQLRLGYGAGYYESMVAALLTDADIEEMEDVDRALTAARDDTLIVTGDRDNCVSATAVAELATRTGVPCTLLKDVGHVGGPKGSTFRTSIFTLSATPIRAHLLGLPSKL